MKKTTVGSIRNSKGKEPLVVITAYDALFARLFCQEADILLVGDSLNMSFLGKKDTLSATLEQMIYHTQAVCAGASESFVVLDMPFGTYNDKTLALANCIKVYKETNASAVKIEGGIDKAEIISHLVHNGIAVMGHIGLMPQFVRAEGGYKIKGKDEVSTESLIKDAKAVESAGAFAIVIEGVKSESAAKVAASVDIPLIGIGSGNGVDGQVLVWSDMFGFFTEFCPKFVRKYMDGATLIKEGMQRYAKDVKSRDFPNSEESY